MKYTIAQRQQVRDLRDQGFFLKEIAAKMGVSTGFVAYWGSNARDDVPLKKIAKLRGKGMGQEAIAKQLYLPRSVVARALLELGDDYDARRNGNNHAKSKAKKHD